MKQTATASSVQYQNSHAVVSDINKYRSIPDSHLETKNIMLN